MKIKWQKIIIAISIFLISMTIFRKYIDITKQNEKINISKVNLSTFLNKVKNNQIKEATFKEDEVLYKTTDSNTIYQTKIPTTMQENIISKVYKNDVKIKYEPEDEKNVKSKKKRIDNSAFINIISDLIFFIIFAFILRSGMSSNRGGMMNMNKKNEPSKSNITFKDVAGIDTYRNEVSEILDFLKNPDLYTKYGAKIPKGLLLCGPPGTGKTLIAKALAGEANVPFYSCAGSDFVEMFVGLGAARIRELFATASKNKVAIIFIDEIDAIGGSRKNNISNGSNSEHMNTLNALLVEMDGFKRNNSTIIVIGATNRYEVLDEALVRPGRFDRVINVPLPDINGREKIINLILSKIKIPSNLNTRSIAYITPGFSGADLTSLINEAVIYAIRNRESVLTSKLVEMARDKILHGLPDGREHQMDELICTAYHEAGHAILAHHFKNLVDPIFKLTIESHGNTLGFLSCFPDRDTMQSSKAKYLARIKVTLGGRAAEEIFFGKDNVTSGAASDFYQATKVANGMVRRWGMSNNGILVMDIYDNTEPYLVSDKMKDSLYLEAKNIVDEAYEEVIQILKSYEKHMHCLVYYLISNGTLYKHDIENILNSVYYMVGPLSSINILNENLRPEDKQKIII